MVSRNFFGAQVRSAACYSTQCTPSGRCVYEYVG